jgi:hypothetical protein
MAGTPGIGPLARTAECIDCLLDGFPQPDRDALPEQLAEQVRCFLFLRLAGRCLWFSRGSRWLVGFGSEALVLVHETQPATKSVLTNQGALPEWLSTCGEVLQKGMSFR